MIEFFNTLLQTHSMAVSAAASVIFAIAMLSLRPVRLALIDAWIRLPFIGLMDRLANRHAAASDGWLVSERILCGKYAQHMSHLSAGRFEHNANYLRLAGDHGRTPLPRWLLISLILLMVMEGYAAGVLIGSNLAPDGSANTHDVLGVLVAAVYAVVMFMATYFAARQFHETRQKRECIETNKASSPNGKACMSQQVALSQSQDVDADENDSVRKFNRIASSANDRGSYALVYMAGLLIVGSLVMICILRIASMQSTSAGSEGGLFSSGVFPMGEYVAGLATNVFLGLLFLGLHLGSACKSVHHAVAGRESLAALKENQWCSTYHQFLGKQAGVRKLGDLRLRQLQERLHRQSVKKMELTRSFDDYLKECVRDDEALSRVQTGGERLRMVDSVPRSSSTKTNRDFSQKSSLGEPNTSKSDGEIHENYYF